MQQRRWIAPGEWIGTLLSDESQVTFVTEVLSLTATPIGLSGQIELQNLGPKPRAAWVVLDAKPATVAWSTDSTVTLLSRPVRVGTGVVENVSYNSSYPREGAETWDLRVRLLGYAPGVSEPEDVYYDYTTTYPADIPGNGLDLAMDAPTDNSWQLPVFVSTFPGGNLVLVLLVVALGIGVLGYHLYRGA